MSKMSFVLGSTQHGPMLFSRLDYRMVDANQGYGVGFQLMEKGSFDPEEINFVKQLLLARRKHHGDGVVALDCGANIGVHTIEWAKLMEGWGSVTAFEAQERIFYALAGNITLNNCFNARAVLAAVGDKTGHIDIPNPNYLESSSFGSFELAKTANTEFIGQDIDYENGPKTRIPMITLESLALKRLDLLKIDIEGMEMQALDGASDMIEKTRPIVVIEVIKSDKAEIESYLGSMGYTLFAFGLNYLAVHQDDPVLGDIQMTPI